MKLPNFLLSNEISFASRVPWAFRAISLASFGLSKSGALEPRGMKSGTLLTRGLRLTRKTLFRFQTAQFHTKIDAFFSISEI